MSVMSSSLSPLDLASLTILCPACGQPCSRDSLAIGSCHSCRGPNTDPVEPDPSQDNADEAAWWLGFTLGVDMHDSGPSADFPIDSARAFLDGFDAARREAQQTHADRMAWNDYLDAIDLAERMLDMEQEYEEQEVSESGSPLGHCGEQGKNPETFR